MLYIYITKMGDFFNMYGIDRVLDNYEPNHPFGSIMEELDNQGKQASLKPTIEEMKQTQDELNFVIKDKYALLKKRKDKSNDLSKKLDEEPQVVTGGSYSKKLKKVALQPTLRDIGSGFDSFIKKMK